MSQESSRKAARSEFAGLIKAYYRETAEQFMVEARLLESEPLLPPSSLSERRAWEARIQARQAAIRRAIAELADLALIEAATRDDAAPEPD